MKVYVVHGSPLSGKTTYVQRHKGPNDIIFDFDLIMSALSGLPVHQHNDNLLGYVLDIRDLIISRLKSEKNIDNAWIIATKVTNKLKNSLIGLNPEYIELKIDKQTALERLKSNPGNRDIEVWSKAINDYFIATEDFSWFYRSPEWERKRIVILKRDNYLCRECGRYGKVTPANVVHHVIPLSERPDLRLDNRNLISLCEECHNKMHNKLDNTLSKLGEEWRERTLRKYPELAA